MAAWSQILNIVGNSALFYLSFDTHDSPGSVFIWKSKFTIYKIWKCGKNLSQIFLCGLSYNVCPTFLLDLGNFLIVQSMSNSLSSLLFSSDDSELSRIFWPSRKSKKRFQIWFAYFSSKTIREFTMRNFEIGCWR